MSRWDIFRWGTLAGGSPIRRTAPHIVASFVHLLSFNGLFDRLRKTLSCFSLTTLYHSAAQPESLSAFPGGAMKNAVAFFPDDITA